MTEQKLAPSDCVFADRQTHLRFYILCIIFAINITCRCLILEPKRYVANLGRQVVFKVQQTSLTDVLALRACLTNDCCLVPHARTSIPTKNSESESECSPMISNGYGR